MIAQSWQDGQRPQPKAPRFETKHPKMTARTRLWGSKLPKVGSICCICICIYPLGLLGSPEREKQHGHHRSPKRKKEEESQNLCCLHVHCSKLLEAAVGATRFCSRNPMKPRACPIGTTQSRDKSLVPNLEAPGPHKYRRNGPIGLVLRCWTVILSTVGLW